MKKILFVISACAILLSCGNTKKSNQCVITDSLKQEVKKEGLMIEGSWVKSIPEQNKVQGFELEAEGEIKGINIDSLNYKLWKFNDTDSILTLITENKERITDTLNYKVVRLKNDTLILLKDGIEDVFTAKK